MKKSELENRIKELELELSNLKSGAIAISHTNRKTIDAEKAKLESEEKFSTIFNMSQSLICVADINTATFKFINPAFKKVLGYNENEVLSKPFLEFVHPDDVKATRDVIQKDLKKGKPKIYFVNRYKCKDGHYRHLAWNSFPIPEKGITYAIAHDITEQKKIEQELKKSQLLLQSSIENQLDTIIFSIDIDYRYLYFNKAHVEVMKYAYDKDIKIGVNILDCITSDDDRIEAKSNYDRALSGESHTNIREYGDVNRSYYESFFNPIRNDNNEIIGCTGLARNVTERKQSELELIEAKETAEVNEEKFRNLFENSPIGKSMTGIDGSLHVNKSFCEIVGYSKEELLDKKWKEISYPDDIPLTNEKIQSLLNGESEKVFFEKRYIHKNGSIVWADLSTFLQRDKEKQPEYFITTIIDITERKNYENELIKAKEKAEESDRLKSAFLTNMSHEIRTPMNGILGFAELLKNPTLSTEEQNQFIGIIGISGQRMLNTINDIIDISKIESGLVSANIQEANINEKMEFTYKFFKPLAEIKGIQLSFKNGLPDKEAKIYTDNEKLYGILTNLVRNAIKFTQVGSIEIGYVLKSDSELGSTEPSRSAELEFYVKDTGSGISEQQKEIIFERFRQGSESHTRGYEGSGLGLSISKSFVEMLGGRIWVESQEGKGSTFYFTIPYNVESETDKKIKDNVHPEPKDAEINPEVSGLKTLIVEDDEISYSLLSLSLDKVSSEVLHAITGVEAVEACRNNPDLDLVLMDIRMPEMNGLEATRQIRKFNKDLVIIAQTAYGFESDCKMALEAGCNDYISKPVDMNLLHGLIKKHVK